MDVDQQFRRRPPPPRDTSNPFDDDTITDDNSQNNYRNNSNNNPEAAPHDPLLDLYERRLAEDIDRDFFNDPSEFQALNRVIDIIGAEIDNSGGDIRPGSEIGTNFTHLQQYQSIQHQQRIVEEVIEHMAVKHCADLNSSVAAVGRMSRQFDEAKLRVKNLRRQVRDVKDSLRLGELGDVATDLVRFVGDIFRLSWGLFVGLFWCCCYFLS